MTMQTREDKEKREFEERLENAIRTEKENEELKRAERQHEVCRSTSLDSRIIYSDCFRRQHGIGRMCSKRVCSRRTQSGKHRKRQSKRSRRKQEPRNTIYFAM